MDFHQVTATTIQFSISKEPYGIELHGQITKRSNQNYGIKHLRSKKDVFTKNRIQMEIVSETKRDVFIELGVKEI